MLKLNPNKIKGRYVLKFYNENDWKQELSHNITSADTLADMGYMDKDMCARINLISAKYPMSVTRYYLSLIQKKDYSDPIYKMCIASLDEGRAGGEKDTSGEADNTVSSGIQHKYTNTVLLLSTNVCAMYCRHCFRKRLVGRSEEEILKFSDLALDYIRQHSEVDNVLISGGDALMCGNKVISRYLKGLSEIGHIKFIRFGSRIPVVLPQRIFGDAELLALFEKYSKIKTIYLVTQFNHPRELTDEALKATDSLRQAGVPVLNQTVLLRGVNDNAETLKNLFNGLAAAGISPYYLFQCRPVKGVKGLFAVPLPEACKIVDDTRAGLSGIAKRFRFIMSHIKGKLEILGLDTDGKLLLKQHHAKSPEDINNIITVGVNNQSYWLNDDLTAPV
jgi:KamA family protein